ncbi:MAG: DUF5818 domain-containing protein [Terriglobia bacterium]|nr:DUF5818 domain-containing protein [Terriglobia bacterium]
MKKLALATAFLFASSMFVMAQSTTSPSSTDQQQPSATSPSTQSAPTSTMPSDQSAQPSDQSAQSSMGSSSSSEQTIQGCLSQGANGFTLADASGTTYNLTGDTSKLSSHVGEQVAVKGTPSSSAASTSGAAGSEASSASPSSASGQNFDVKSVKRISKSCSTSGSPSSK